ncbi:E3 ubiquitin-protein ligase TRIM31 isoform X1 [Bos taurus]|uniref:Tripartite motif containing 31 n=1 Tax=Bos taurus TaxID=9913 RepID=A0AAA9U0Q1_BOVIN|nr:E3 ubiquitin-protein ligase TRIM31 isoform X1 [Bos taurus]XP_024839804.1 E3 ubiquitin-protein ligase TRIM31 isoform X1 [Bos taurus]XP_059736613.1 E3 ubiquitin-protein ligase TRIM31 isoform X1 [Bos taurus]DAA16435.1 TPA: tripartite motif-containing protein 31-like [Bos taurus]
MAHQQFTGKLQEEMICPICLDILQDPATIDCGHNFCLSCITQSGEAADSVLKCPLCNKIVKRDTITPNWLLVNLVEKIQAMDPSDMQPETEELRCLRHGEKCHYFCEVDGKFLCVVCRESKDHKTHNTTLIEEAAQNYQGRIQSQIEVLQQKEREIIQVMAQGEHCIKVSMYQVELEKEMVIEAFRQLRKVLKEEKSFLLSRINWLGQEISKGEKLYVTSTKSQLNYLRKLKDSLKSRQCLPPGQLLQDIKIALCRSEAFRFLNPTPVSMDLEKKLSDIKSRHDSLTKSLKKFKDILQADSKKDKSKFLSGLSEEDRKSWYLAEKNDPKTNKTSEPELSPPVDRTTKPVLQNPKLSISLSPLFRKRNRDSFVSYSSNRDSSENLGSPGATNIEELKTMIDPLTLDAASAHPDLIISQDLKTVTLKPVPQRVCAGDTDPERFYPFRCVLGLPGLCSGCQTWEAELQGPEGGGCVVGVASELVPRKGMLQIEPLSGFWALRIAGSECQALTETGTREDLSVCLRKVGVHVNHECGKVVFYDATTSNHLYTFHASFPGQIFPFFRLLVPGTQITLSP